MTQQAGLSRIIQIASTVIPGRRKSSSASKGKRRYSFHNSMSRNSSINSTASEDLSSSPPVRGRMSYDVSGSGGSSVSSTSGSSPLAQQGYPHIHIREKVYKCCRMSPQHSVEEQTHDCTCGKVVVERYRELYTVDALDCPKCIEEEEYFDGF